MLRRRIRTAVFAFVAIASAASFTALAVGATRERASTGDLTRQLIGHSVRGRAIYAYRLGDPSGTPVLVVGSIHGNEPGGIAVAKRLLGVPAPANVDLWVILELNPDGYAAGTRGNAHGVDLNRNFPWGWRRLAGGISGPYSLSEPESRAVARLIRRVRPRLTIWFHQPLGLVDGSRRSPALERRFALLSGLPLKQLKGRYPGAASHWERHLVPGAVAFVAELPGGTPGASKVNRYARAVLAVSAQAS